MMEKRRKKRGGGLKEVGNTAEFHTIMIAAHS